MRVSNLAVLSAVFLSGLSPSHAADLDYGPLRGGEYEAAAPLVDWGGAYVGAHGGYSSAGFAYPNNFGPMASEWAAKSNDPPGFTSAVVTAANGLQVFRDRREGGSFGAYAGYNVHFDDAVFGAEIDYTRFSLTGASTSSAATVFNDGVNDVRLTVAGTSTTQISDFGTVRARIGYALGSFLPFVTAGVALGNGKVSEQLSTRATVPGYNRTISQSNFDNGVSNTVNGLYTKSTLLAGVALGGGLEYALTNNIILRGEYQYINFDDFAGHRTTLNTIRGGAAFKF